MDETGAGDEPTPAPPPISLVGVTDDGAVLFSRRDEQTLEVLDPASGTSTVLASPFAPTDRVMVAGKIVAFWTTVAGGGSNELSVWTTGRGVLHVPGSASPGVFAATETVKRMAWLRTAPDGATSELVVGPPGAPVAVVTGIAGGAGAGECAARLEFVNGRLFAATCGPGDVAPTIRTVSKKNEVTTLLVSAKNEWSIDAGGSSVFLVSSNGDATVHAMPGGNVTAIDGDVTWGQIRPSGDTVVYRTGATALKQASTRENGGRAMIAPSGVRSVPAIASDFSFILSSSTAQDVVGRDLALFPLRVELMEDPPMIPTPTLPGEMLVSTPTAEALGFIDLAASVVGGRYAVFVSDLTSAGLGTLRMHTCPSNDVPSKEVVLAEGALTPKLVPQSSLVVFANQPRFDGAKVTTVDLRAVDPLSRSTHTLATGVDPEFVVGRSVVAYTVNHASVVTAPLP